MIEVEGLIKSYKISSLQSIEVLHDISFNIEDGEFVAIMGPSGAGKSTLLHCISALELPTHGKVKINEHHLRAMTETQMNDFRYGQLGYVFQDYYLEEILTNNENIIYPLKMHGLDNHEIERRVNEVAERLEISHILSKFPNECSGGQQQRVAIARALVTLPQLIIADEPTGNLDSRTGLELMRFFQELNEEGKTIVLVTHDCLVASFSSRLIYLQDGRIVSELKKEELPQKEYYEKIVALNTNKGQEEEGR